MDVSTLTLVQKYRHGTCKRTLITVDFYFFFFAKMINIPQAVYPALATVFASQEVHVVSLLGVDLNVFDWTSPHNTQTVVPSGRKYPSAHTAEKNLIVHDWVA